VPRQQLAAAIERLRSARAELASARSAKEASEAQVSQARYAVSECEAGIERAREDAVGYATALATGTAGAAPISAAQRKLMLDAAREHVAVVRDADIGLAARLKRAEDSVSLLESRVERIRGNVLRDAPEVIHLLRRHDQLRHDLLAVEELLTLLAFHGAFGSLDWRVLGTRGSGPSEETIGLAAQWRDAIARLADDPDAPLPS
jgi:hypothetical protein